MVWRDVTPRFDHTRCPNCDSKMKLAKVEPRPLRSNLDFERHVYQCERCLNLSKFVIDRRSWDDRMTA